MKWKTEFDLNITVPLWIEDHLFISTGYGTGCAKLKIVKKDDEQLAVKRVYHNEDLCNHFGNSVYFKGHIYGFDRSNGDFVCLDYATGEVKWRQKDFGRGQLLVVDDRILVQTEGAQDQKKGEEVNARIILMEPTPEEYREVSSFVFSHEVKCWAAPAFANKKLYVRDNKKLMCYDLVAK
jgi:hypothetical protein